MCGWLHGTAWVSFGHGSLVLSSISEPVRQSPTRSWSSFRFPTVGVVLGAAGLGRAPAADAGEWPEPSDATTATTTAAHAAAAAAAAHFHRAPAAGAPGRRPATGESLARRPRVPRSWLPRSRAASPGPAQAAATGRPTPDGCVTASVACCADLSKSRDGSQSVRSAADG